MGRNLSAVCKATPKAASRLLGQFQKRFSTKFAPLARIYYHFVLPPLPRGRVLPQAETERKGGQMSLEGTREAVTKYLDSEHSDTSMMADDVVFTIMATGEEHRG